MGMYTQLVLGVEFKKTVPLKVLAQLHFMTGNRETGISPADMMDTQAERDFFRCPRWRLVLSGDSYYFDWKTMRQFDYDIISHSWYLTVVSNLKNYDGEIAKFLFWIAPHIHTNGYLGFTRYEETETPTLIYKWENDQIQFFTPEGAPND